MTYSNCDPALTLMGPFLVLVGSLVAYVGLLAWIKPDSQIVQDSVLNQYPSEQEASPILRDLGFTREQLGPLNMLMLRLLGPLIGAVFAIVGLWVTISQIHCGERVPDPRPLFGPLAWRHVALLFVLFVGLIGVWNARRMRPILRELYVLFLLLFGVAASEAAAFHVGVQAARWGAIAVIAIALSGVVWFANVRLGALRPKMRTSSTED